MPGKQEQVTRGEIEAIRAARSLLRKERKRRGRGRALFGKAHDIQEWPALSVQDQKMWINAADKAQLFEHDENPLLKAAMLGELLGFYDQAKASSHVLQESSFLQLPTEDQLLLFRLALNLVEPIVVEDRPSAVATIELYGPISAPGADRFFDQLADAVGDLEDEQDSERGWAPILSMRHFGASRQRSRKVFRRDAAFSHNAEVL